MKKRLTKLLGIITLSLAVVPNISQAISFSNIFFLGDSLSDVGNLFTATSTTLPVPLPQDPPYYQGRFSDGPSFTEHLWQRLGMPGALTPSFTGGNNFAVGGARSRYHVFDISDPTFNPLFDTTAVPAFTLLGQRDLLLTRYGGVLDPAALYTVWIGSNDVADAFAALAGGASPTFVNDLLFQSANDIAAVIGDLVGAGAHKLLVPNVPNLGLVPEVLALPPALGASAIATGLSQTFNGMIDNLLAGIGAEFIRLDTFQFLTDLVTDPTLFDLPAGTNVTTPCFTGFVGQSGAVCSNPEAHVFWDEIHPSAVTHALLGELAAKAVPEPASIALFGVGFAAFGFARRRVAV